MLYCAVLLNKGMRLEIIHSGTSPGSIFIRGRSLKVNFKVRNNISSRRRASVQEGFVARDSVIRLN